MPRKSVASLSVVSPTPDGQPTRLAPPAHLSAAERRRFLELVNASDPKHFRPSDLSLLIPYVQQSCLADHAFAMMKKTGGAVLQDGTPNPWLAVQARSIRMMTILATRLRLSPQSRISQRQAGRMGTPPSFYEMQERDNDDAG